MKFPRGEFIFFITRFDSGREDSFYIKITLFMKFFSPFFATHYYFTFILSLFIKKNCRRVLATLSLTVVFYPSELKRL